MAMKFIIEIELGNDAMERSDDVRRALKELHRHLGDQWIRGQLLNREDGGKIMDVNGNSVGKWEVLDKSPLETFFQEVADLTVDHDVIGDSASVSPNKLGHALSKVDPDWFNNV